MTPESTSSMIEGDLKYGCDERKYPIMRQNSAKFDTWDQAQYFINNLLMDLAYFAEDKTNGTRSTFDIFEALVLRTVMLRSS